MLYLLTITHGILLIWAAYNSYKLIRHFSSLGLVTLGVIIFDSLGILILPYINWHPPYLREVIIPLRENFDFYLYLRICLAHWIFLILSYFGFLYEKKILKVRRSLREGKLSLFGKIYCFVIIIFGIVAYVRFFHFGPGIQLLSRFNLFNPSPVEAVTARVLSRVPKGVGAFAASLTAFNILPLFACIILLRNNYEKNRLKALFWTFLFGLLSILFMVTNYQKAPLVSAIIIYAGLYYISRPQVKINKRILLHIGIFGILSSFVLYIINFGLVFKDAYISTIERLFLIPSNVESYWFLFYPDFSKYEGLGFVLITNMEVIQKVATFITGFPSSTNASFLAVGWSGSGWIGIFISSAFLVISLTLLDLFFSTYKFRYRLIHMLFTGSATFYLISGSVADFYFKGAITSFLLALAFISSRIGFLQPSGRIATNENSIFGTS